jgi:phage shock protein E
VNLELWIVIAGAVIAFVLLKRISLVSAARAHECLKQGALVIDVRSQGEFRERHLPAALNLPLGQLREGILRHAPDKGQPLLLHCLSGTRSGIAKAQLKRMGYRNVFNLGSYGRAEKTVGAQGQARQSTRS